MATLKELWEDAKAWLRGEKRVASYGVRGRVYQRRDEQPSIAGLIASGKFTGTIRPTRVFVAAENKWYKINEDGTRTPEG